MATKPNPATSDHRFHYGYATTGKIPGIGESGVPPIEKKEGGQVIKPTPYKRGGRSKK